MKVGRVECRRVTGVIEKGSVHEGRLCSVGTRDRGGCVDGVIMSFVRTMSMGAKITPAIPAALTAAARLNSGEAEERISKPPTADGLYIR